MKLIENLNNNILEIKRESRYIIIDIDMSDEYVKIYKRINKGDYVIYNFTVHLLSESRPFSIHLNLSPNYIINAWNFVKSSTEPNIYVLILPYIDIASGEINVNYYIFPIDASVSNFGLGCFRDERRNKSTDEDTTENDPVRFSPGRSLLRIIRFSMI